MFALVTKKTHKFKGYMDEFVVYDKKLSDDQLQCLYDKECTHPCLKCQDTLTKCLKCKDTDLRELPNCDCKLGYYENSSQKCTGINLKQYIFIIIIKKIIICIYIFKWNMFNRM